MKVSESASHIPMYRCKTTKPVCFPVASVCFPQINQRDGKSHYAIRSSKPGSTFLRRTTMNTIRFNFDDLCAIFSRYSSRLMVGMISTDGEAPQHVHQPHIIIKRDGVVEREYHTWAEINGDILLEVFPDGKPLSRYTPESPGDPRRPFSMIVDIEKDLHPKENLQVNPRLCRARFYFKNGELYSTNQFINLRYVDVKTGQVCGHAPTKATSNGGLDVEIPEEGYARLRFFNGTEDFTFRSGSD